MSSSKLSQNFYRFIFLFRFQATDTFSHVISGGRDKKVIMTELRSTDKCTVICEEKAPILKMAMTPDQTSLWVATSESTINNWV